jgi:hypothetical protein
MGQNSGRIFGEGRLENSIPHQTLGYHDGWVGLEDGREPTIPVDAE